MRKSLIPRHMRPALVILAVLTTTSLLDTTGAVTVSDWVLYTEFGLYMAAWVYAILHTRTAGWRVKDDRRPSWAEDDSSQK